MSSFARTPYQSTAAATGAANAGPAVAPRPRRARPVLGWAWSIPVLVATQFAMLALIPVLVVVRRTWRNPALRTMRPWAATLAAAYLTPLALWAVGPDREGSLSKDMHPALAVVLVLVAAAYAMRLHFLRPTAGPR